MQLSPPDDLRPNALYESLYAAATPRRFAAPATDDPAAWATWRSGFTVALRRRLALPAERSADVRCESAPPTQHDGYRRTYVELAAGPDSTVPAWLLVPDGLREPAPAVIALHGHGYGADDTVGIAADGAERPAPEGFHQNFARALGRQGFVVLAPELRGFGRRREAADRASGPGASSCESAAWWGIMLGRPLLGSRIADTLSALDWLAARPEVDAERVGVMGGSGGGTVALFAAALEPRLRAAVVSGYFCSWRDSILAMHHCHCNYVPGILEDGEIADVAALVAPRPLLVASGDHDPIFPLPGVRDAYGQLERSYQAQNAAAALELEIFAGGHESVTEPGYAFLRRRLA